MSAKELLMVRYMMDGSESKIISYHDLMESDELLDKSKPRLNLIFEKFWTKYSEKVGMLLMVNIYCNTSHKYYVSIFDIKEVSVIEEIIKEGKMVEIDYFCVYNKDLYQDKKDVLKKYEEVNLVKLQNEQKDDECEKITKKIRQVYLGSKETKNENKPDKKDFFKKSKTNSITSFFKMGK